MKKLYTLLFAFEFVAFGNAQHVKISPSADLQPIENI